MTRSLRLLAVLFIAFMAAGVGCKSDDKTQVDQGAAGDDAAIEEMAADNAGEDEAAAIEAELAKLSPADRELVAAQKICPVSKAPLGSMGPPIPVKVDDRTLFICCAHCEEEAKKDFDKFFAAIEKPADDEAAN